VTGALGAIAAVVTLLVAPSYARAQSWEVSGLAGFTPSVSLDKQASELSEVKIAGGFTWGIQGARLFGPRWAAEVLWTQQESALRVGTDAGTADLFTMTIGQLHGDVVYHFASTGTRLRPFVFGGVGATFFRADELDSETKLSFGLGGGIKYFRWDTVGFRAHVRYKPTMLNDTDAADFCDPFGFCQGGLSQLEFAGGVTIRF
jgi:hypothetical protein